MATPPIEFKPHRKRVRKLPSLSAATLFGQQPAAAPPGMIVGDDAENAIAKQSSH